MNSTDDFAKLLNQLTKREPEKQLQARLAITQFGDAAVEPLIEVLKNPEHSDSWWLVADALGDIGDKRAVEPLVELLKNPLSFDAILVRKYTAGALGKLKDARAVDVLIELLHERIHDEEEDDFIYDEPDHDTIEAAMWALTEIGDTRAVEPIIQRIFEGDHYQNGSLLTPWGEPALNRLLDSLNSDNENIRGYAASLLGEFGDRQAVQPLIDLLQNDSNDSVRHSAAYALGELSGPRAYDVLLAALNDTYEQTRAYAAMGLGKLKDKRAIDALKKATQDEHLIVQNFAKWALEWIENP